MPVQVYGGGVNKEAVGGPGAPGGVPMKAEIPKVSEKAIKDRIDVRSYQRGEAYFRQGRIFDARRQGRTLKARCEGSQGGPYRVSITFDGSRIGEAECSCPVGSAGFCKHVAALLMTWRAKPEEFAEVEELDAALERRSKPELIALIKQFLRRQPELELLLEAPKPGAGGKPANPDTYRRRARAAFKGFEYSDWGHGYADPSDELRPIFEDGAAFLEQGDYQAASAVFEGLAGAIAEDYDTVPDEEGAVAALVGDCIDGLGECLANIQDDPARREAILRALFDAFEFQRGYGGGSEADVPSLIARHASDEERRTVAAWVREAMPGPRDGAGGYRSKAYGEFLVDLEGDSLDDEAFLRICRESGMTGELIERLIRRGRLDEAVAELRRADGYELPRLADLFVSLRKGDLAERVVRERAESKPDRQLLQWLKARHAARKETDQVRELALTIFRREPSLEGYRELKKLTRKADWEETRAKLLAQLAKPGNDYLLIQIYLDEGEIDRAIERVNAERGFGSGMRLEVARAAEKTRPRDALEIYRKQAERLIEAQGRGNYQEACRYLKKVRDLHESVEDRRGWDYYVGVLRERFQRLPAFQDELRKAKL